MELAASSTKVSMLKTICLIETREKCGMGTLRPHELGNLSYCCCPGIIILFSSRLPIACINERAVIFHLSCLLFAFYELMQNSYHFKSRSFEHSHLQRS